MSKSIEKTPKALDILRENVERELNSRDWKQIDLANELKITKQQIYSWLNSEKVPGMGVIDRLAKALDTTPAKLLSTPTEQLGTTDPIKMIEAGLRVLKEQGTAQTKLPAQFIKDCEKLSDDDFNHIWAGVKALTDDFEEEAEEEPKAIKKKSSGIN